MRDDLEKYFQDGASEFNRSPSDAVWDGLAAGLTQRAPWYRQISTSQWLLGGAAVAMFLYIIYLHYTMNSRVQGLEHTIDRYAQAEQRWEVRWDTLQRELMAVETAQAAQPDTIYVYKTVEVRAEPPVYASTEAPMLPPPSLRYPGPDDRYWASQNQAERAQSGANGLAEELAIPDTQIADSTPQATPVEVAMVEVAMEEETTAREVTRAENLPALNTGTRAVEQGNLAYSPSRARHYGYLPYYKPYEVEDSPLLGPETWTYSVGARGTMLSGNTDLPGTASQQSMGGYLVMHKNRLWLDGGAQLTRLHYVATLGSNQTDAAMAYPGTVETATLGEVRMNAIYLELPFQMSYTLTPGWHRPLKAGLGASWMLWPNQYYTYRYANVGLGNTDTYTLYRRFVYFGQGMASLGATLPFADGTALDLELTWQRNLVPLGVERRAYTLFGLRAGYRWGW